MRNRQSLDYSQEVCNNNKKHFAKPLDFLRGWILICRFTTVKKLRTPQVQNGSTFRSLSSFVRILIPKIHTSTEREMAEPYPRFDQEDSIVLLFKKYKWEKVRYPDIQISRYSDIQIFRYSNIQISRYSNIQTSKNPKIQKIGNSEIRTFKDSDHEKIKRTMIFNCVVLPRTGWDFRQAGGRWWALWTRLLSAQLAWFWNQLGFLASGSRWWALQTRGLSVQLAWLSW